MLQLQILLNGILLGGLYGLTALGFSLVWGITNIINLAHGVFIVLGAYITYWMFELTGIDPFLTIPVSMLMLFLLGYIVQSSIINLIIRAPIFMTLLLTFGIEIALTNIILLTWSADYRMVTPWYSGSGISTEGIAVPYIRILTFLIAISLTVLLHLFLTKTKTGNAIRATGMDIIAAKLNGVNVSRIYSITFGIGAALAGSAGSLISVTHSFSPTIGGSLTLKSFVICVLGGLGSAGGALVGGVVLGLVESFGSVYLGSGFKDAISFAMLVLVLVVSPRGILGKEFYR